MLILTRHPRQVVMIGQDIQILVLDIAGDRVQVLLNMVDNKFQIVSSKGSDGSFFVKDRKYPGSDDESPWQLRCSGK